MESASATWPVYSPFARKHFGAGKTAGLAEGEARVVLTILEVRGIPVSDAERTRVITCTDLEQLDEWARRAVTAASTRDVFADEQEHPVR